MPGNVKTGQNRPSIPREERFFSYNPKWDGDSLCKNSSRSIRKQKEISLIQLESLKDYFSSVCVRERQWFIIVDTCSWATTFYSTEQTQYVTTKKIHNSTLNLPLLDFWHAFRHEAMQEVSWLFSRIISAQLVITNIPQRQFTCMNAHLVELICKWMQSLQSKHTGWMCSHLKERVCIVGLQAGLKQLRFKTADSWTFMVSLHLTWDVRMTSVAQTVLKSSLRSSNSKQEV